MPANAPKVLLRSEQSGGVLSVIELTGSGTPPLHRHDFDETFSVLEGELTFHLDGELFTRRAGEVAFAPRGIAAHITGVQPPPEAAKPIPEVITLGPPIGEPHQTNDPERRQR